jgi:hypothetical protein
LLAVFATGSWATVDYSFTSKFSDTARAADGSNSAVENGSVSGGGQIVFTGPTSGTTSLHATGSGEGKIFFTPGPTVPYTFNVTSFGGDFEVTNGAITGSFEDHGIFMTEARTGSYSLSGSLTAGSSVSFVSNPYPINLFFGGTQTDGTIFSGSTTGGKATNNNTTPTNIAAEVTPDLPPTSFEFIVSNSGTQMDAANPNAPLSHVKLYWSSSEDVAGKLGEIPLQGDPGIYWNTDSVTISSEFDDLPTGPKGAKYIVVVADGDDKLGSKVTVNTAAIKIPFVWTGKGSSALWSNGDNWLGKTAPSTGDDLVFPADAQQQTNENDLPDTFKSMTVGSNSQSVTAASTIQPMASVDADYHISGQPISVKDLDISSGSLDSSATVTGSATVGVDAKLTAGQGKTLSLEATSQTTVNGTIEGTGKITAKAQSKFAVNPGANFKIGNEFTLGGILDCYGTTTVQPGAQWNTSGTVNVNAKCNLDNNGELTSSGKLTVNAEGQYSVQQQAVYNQNGGDFSLFGAYKQESGGKAKISGGARVVQENGSTSEINGSVDLNDSSWKLNAATNGPGATMTLGAGGNFNATGQASEFSVLFGATVDGPEASVKIDGGLFYNNGKVAVGAVLDTNFGIIVAPGGSLDVFESLTEGEGGNLDVFGTLTIHPTATLNNIAGVVTIEPGATFNALGTIIGPVTYAPPRVTSPAFSETVSFTTATIAGVGHSGRTVSLYSDPNNVSSLSGNGVTLVSSQTAAMDGSYSFTADLTLGAINHFFVTATIGGAQTGIAAVAALTQHDKPWQNAKNRFDADRDTFIVAGDVLSVINYINANKSGALPASRPGNKASVDINGDNNVAADDVIDIINWINGHPGQSEAEDASGAAVTDSAIDDQLTNAATDISPLASFADLVSLLAADAATTVTKRRSSSF